LKTNDPPSPSAVVLGLLCANNNVIGFAVIVRKTLCILTVFLCFGCDFGKTARLEKENEELKAAANKWRTADDYDLQARCSKDAKAWFAAQGLESKETISLYYTNHYNKSSNKCFAWVHHIYKPNAFSWLDSITISNVYENTTDATFVLIREGQKVSVLLCSVGDKKCKDEPEYEEWSHSLMSD
jgi:hypothetical protein